MADQLSEKVPEQANVMEEGKGDNAPVLEMKPSNVPASTNPSYMPLHPRPPRRRLCHRGLLCIGGCFQFPPRPSLGIAEIKDPQFGRMLGAEYVGTMFLVFIGCLSYLTGISGLDLQEESWFIEEDGTNKTLLLPRSGHLPPANTLHVSFAFGIIVATMVQALGHISGAHLNPAVSLGLMVAGKCGLLKVLCYTVAQLFGGITGALLVWLTSKNIRVVDEEYKPNGQIATFNERYPNWGMGASVLFEGVRQFPDGIITEFMLTFLLVLTFISVCDDLRNDIKGSAPLAIGLAVFCCHVAGINFTGVSINPARSFGPALFSSAKNRWIDHWCYWSGPLLGALGAGFVYSSFFKAKTPPPEIRIIGPPQSFDP